LLVGNDVVDLRDPETRLDSVHDRFIERVFTPAERDAIFASRDSRAALWSHWAAKESAYKIIKKAEPDAIFSHRAFQVEFFNRVGGTRLTGSVEHEGRRVDVDVLHAGDTIHAVALLGHWPHRRRVVSDVAPISRSDDPSRAVRGALVESAAREIECGEGELRVVGSRPPRLEHRGAGVGFDVSLSHHGRLVGFAYAPPSGTARHGRPVGASVAGRLRTVD